MRRIIGRLEGEVPSGNLVGVKLEENEGLERRASVRDCGRSSSERDY